MLDRTVIRAEFDRARDELHAMAVTLSKELDSVDEVFRGSGGSADSVAWDAVRPDVFSDPDTFVAVCDALEVNEQLNDALTGAVMEMVA